MRALLICILQVWGGLLKYMWAAVSTPGVVGAWPQTGVAHNGGHDVERARVQVGGGEAPMVKPDDTVKSDVCSIVVHLNLEILDDGLNGGNMAVGMEWPMCIPPDVSSIWPCYIDVCTPASI